ncbi:hypothetical protein BgiMline_026715, partial [Biomphalaria glabrata]
VNILTKQTNMASSGLSKRIQGFVLLMVVGVTVSQNTSVATAAANVNNVTGTTEVSTTSALPTTTTANTVKADVTTGKKNGKIVNYLKGVVLNLTVTEQPWHGFTIQFDEDLLASWLECLNDDKTTRCATETEHVYGSDYVHTANLTVSEKSSDTSKFIFRCALQDQRYIQEKGELLCTRSNLTCDDAFDACKLSSNDKSAIFLWEASQVTEFGHDPEVVQRICGDVCESGQDDDETVAEAVSRVPIFIWIIVGVVGAILLISLIVLIVLLCCIRRQKKKKGSKTLSDQHDQDEKRSSKFLHEEDPSDELRIADNSQVSPIGFVELSELDKSQKKVTSAEAKDENVEHRSSKNIKADGDGKL